MLTNVAAGTPEQSLAVLEAGVPTVVFAVLRSEAVHSWGELCEQCLWVLGNLAAGPESAATRDALLDAGILQELGELYQRIPEFAWHERCRLQVMQLFTWLMSALCDGEPAPALCKVDHCFEFFAQVLVGTDDERMLTDSIWGLVCLVERAVDDLDAEHRCERLLRVELPAEDLALLPKAEGHPLMRRLVALMRGSHTSGSRMPGAAQRLLGALVASPGAGSGLAAASGAVAALRDTLRDATAPVQVRCEAAWTLANLSASGPEQVAQFLQEPGAWQAVGDTLEQGPEEARWEAAWAVAHVARHLGGARPGSKAEPKRALRAIVAALRAVSPAAEPALQLALLGAAEDVLLRRDRTSAKALGPRRALLAMAEDCGLVHELETICRGGRGADVARAGRLLELWFGSGGNENTPKVSNTWPSQVP